MFVLMVIASAQSAQVQIFPEHTLHADELETLLVPELIGPPAPRYDQSTHTGAGASALELAVEKALRVNWDREVPDSLRCWADLFNRARRAGVLSDHAEAFLAEHCGLVTPPWAARMFYTSSGDARQIVPMLQDAVSAMQASEDIGPWTVSVIYDERTLMHHGVLVTMDEPIAFEPFSRTAPLGGMLHIPGVVLHKRRGYELFINRPGTRVDRWTLEPGAAFDLSIALPSEAGRWHVAVAEYQKNRFADSPFYFSLYTGMEAPVSYEALRPAPAPTGLTAEEVVLFQVNEVRATFGLSPFVLAGDPARIREVIASLPANEPAAVRMIRKLYQEDPLPGQPHGTWNGATASGAGCAETGLLLTESPASRVVLLREEGGSFVVGAWNDSGRCKAIAMLVDAAPRGGGVRDVARSDLLGRWPGTAPAPAPTLEGRLDTLAAEIASGTLKLKRSSNALMQRLEALNVPAPWKVQVVYVPPGGTPDVAGFVPTAGGGHLAIGQATGNLGDQPVTYTVLVLVHSGGDLP